MLLELYPRLEIRQHTTLPSTTVDLFCFPIHGHSTRGGTYPLTWSPWNQLWEFGPLSDPALFRPSHFAETTCSLTDALTADMGMHTHPSRTIYQMDLAAYRTMLRLGRWACRGHQGAGGKASILEDYEQVEDIRTWSSPCCSVLENHQLQLEHSASTHLLFYFYLLYNSFSEAYHSLHHYL